MSTSSSRYTAALLFKKWALIVLVVYLLSSGPMAGICARTNSAWLESAIGVLYRPIILLEDTVFGGILFWYADLFSPRPTRFKNGISGHPLTQKYLPAFEIYRSAGNIARSEEWEHLDRQEVERTTDGKPISALYVNLSSCLREAGVVVSDDQTAADLAHLVHIVRVDSTTQDSSWTWIPGRSDDGSWLVSQKWIGGPDNTELERPVTYQVTVDAEDRFLAIRRLYRQPPEVLGVRDKGIRVVSRQSD